MSKNVHELKQDEFNYFFSNSRTPAGEKRKAAELTKYGTAGNKKELKMEDGGG